MYYNKRLVGCSRKGVDFLIHLAAFETCDNLFKDWNQILIARIDTSKPNVEFYGKTYEPLYPRFSFFFKLDDILENLGVEEEPSNVYIELYKKNVLGRLDPFEVYDELKELADNKEDFVLLNESDKECVREALADWFNDAGVPCVIEDYVRAPKAESSDENSNFAGHIIYNPESSDLAQIA